MVKSLRYGLGIFCLTLPILAQAKPCTNDDCDVRFTVTPNFTSACPATALSQTGIYTIKNHTAGSLALTDSIIKNPDDTSSSTGGSITIGTAPNNDCGTSPFTLAAGASCNILVNFESPTPGMWIFDQILQIGIPATSTEINSPAIALSCIPTILGSSTVTNTGNTFVNGDVAVSPGTSITGFPPGVITNGSLRLDDSIAALANSYAQTYYNSAVVQTCTTDLTGQDLGGMTLLPGVYCFSSSAGLTGTLTLDGNGDPNSTFIFQIGSTLTTAASSNIILGNSAVNSNVTWAIGSSATLGTGTAFQGIIDAVTSVTFVTGTSLAGRAWAQNGAITLDTNRVNWTQDGAVALNAK